MKKGRTEPPAPGDLRRRAEERIQNARRQATPEGAAEPDAQRLVNELRVHQVELEMQNEELRRAQRELEAARDQWEDLFEFAPVGYCTIERDGTILRINLAGASLLGKPRAHLTNVRLGALLGETSRAPFSDFLGKLLAGEPERPCEVAVKPEGAAPTILRVAGTMEGTGSTAKITLTDVTEQRRAEKSLRASEEKYRQIVETAHEGVWLIDARDRTTFVNRRMAEILGRAPEEMLGRPLLSFHTEDVRADVEVRLDRHRKGISETFERRFQKKDGSDVWVLMSTNPLPSSDGEYAGALAMVTDITDRRKAEEEIRTHRDHLEELVAERTSSLTKTNAALNELIAVNRRNEKELRESEERLRLAQETAQSGTYEWDLRTNEVLWTPELEKLYGLPAGYFVAHSGEGEKFIHPDDLPGLNALLRNAVAEKSGFRCEFRIRRPDGETRWMEGLGKVFCDATGQPARMVGLNRDITDRKRVEDALARSEETYRGLFEHMRSGLAHCRMLFDDAGRPVDWVHLRVNEAFEEATGLHAIAGRRVSEVIPELLETNPELLERHAGVIRTGRPDKFETYVPVRKAWYSVSIYSPGKDEFLVIMDVVTERKKHEEALRRAVSRLGFALEAARAGWWEWDLATDESLWSDELWHLYGLEPGSCEPSYAAWKRSIHPADVAAVEEAVRKASASGGELLVDWRVATPDGAERWLFSRGRPVRGPNGRPASYVGIVIDITETRQAMNAAERSQTRLAAAFASMSDAVFISDAAGRFVELNDAFASFHRFESRNECPRHLDDYPEILDVFMEDGKLAPLEMWAVSRALRGETVAGAEYTLRRRDTGETWVGSYNFAPIRDWAGTVVGAVVVASDITERKRTEEALASSRRDLELRNDELRALFESAAAAMALYDAEPPFRLLICNRRFQESYPEPLRTTGMVGLTLPEFSPEAATTGILDSFRRVAETGQAVSFREFPYDGFSGGRSWWDWHLAPVFAGGKVEALAFVRIDVTIAVRARKRVEAEISRVKEANRELESFSYSASHDLRAPLRAIHGYSSLLGGHLGAALDDEGRRLLGAIKENSLLMGSLVDGLVEYTRIRSRDLSRTRVDMKGLVESLVAEMLTDGERRRFDVQVADLPSAYADSDLAAALLRHLLSNAFKFSAGRPKPVVEVGFGAGPDGTVYFVKDNGVGFDPKYLDKLFGVFHRLDGPPQPGRTGIGLAIAKRIVERHGGWIRAESAVDQGATFRFSLVPGQEI